MARDRVNFFISHAGADRAWAEWVAWQLTDAGYSIELDLWDWPVGRNFMTRASENLHDGGGSYRWVVDGPRRRKYDGNFHRSKYP